MNRRNILAALLVSVVLVLGIGLVFWLINRPVSDGEFEYDWSDELGGYYISADKSSYGEVLNIPAEYEGKPIVAIEQKGFAGISGFKTVKLPDSVKKVNYAAFKECPDLEVIDWSMTAVEAVGNYAFYECDKLTTFKFPKNTKVVSNSTFYGCDALVSVEMSEGILTVMDRAFSRCKALTAITIPKNVT